MFSLFHYISSAIVSCVSEQRAFPDNEVQHVVRGKNDLMSEDPKEARFPAQFTPRCGEETATIRLPMFVTFLRNDSDVFVCPVPTSRCQLNNNNENRRKIYLEQWSKLMIEHRKMYRLILPWRPRQPAFIHLSSINSRLLRGTMAG